MSLQERALTKLERQFDRLARQRTVASDLKKLSKGGKIEARPDAINRQSREHAKATRNLLKIIDRYAELHTRLRGRAALTSNMGRELSAFTVEPRVRFHPQLSKAVARALATHQNRLRQLFTKAEEIRVKHGVFVSMRA